MDAESSALLAVPRAHHTRQHISVMSKPVSSTHRPYCTRCWVTGQTPGDKGNKGAQSRYIWQELFWQLFSLQRKYSCVQLMFIKSLRLCQSFQVSSVMSHPVCGRSLVICLLVESFFGCTRLNIKFSQTCTLFLLDYMDGRASMGKENTKISKTFVYTSIIRVS